MAMYEGNISGEGLKVALVVSRFNSAVTEKLVTGATDELVRHGVAEDAIDIYRVPGAYDLPPVAQRAAASGRYNAIVCLGAVIRGATPHFEYVAAEATKGIAQVAQTANCPVTFGVLTCDNSDQAWERAGGKAGNKGSDAARAAMELADLYKHFG